MNTRKIFGIGLALCCCLPLQLSAAVSGCNNGYLLGNYNAQVSSMNLQSVLQAVNTTGTPVTPAGTPATPTVIGFGSNPRSISGSMAGTGRYYFDGAGTIVGLSAPATNGNTFASAIGKYTVNLDCTATLSLDTGASFDAVLANGGQQVLFVETDSTGSGSVGSLQKASSCVSLNYPQSYAFSFSGASQQAAAASTGNGNTGTAAATATTSFLPYSIVGALYTDGNGNFSISETSINNGSVVRSKGGGSYTVGTDCSLKLSFSSSFPGTTTNFKAPSSLVGLTSDSTGGVLLIQPDANTTLTGSFVVQ